MRTFNVYKHSNASFEAVKVGFSWPCLFFGLIWAAVKQLWKVVAIVVALVVVSFLFEELAYASSAREVGSLVTVVLNLAFWVGWLIFAGRANEVREANLCTRGYRRVASVQADSPEAAIAQVQASEEPADLPESSLSA